MNTLSNDVDLAAMFGLEMDTGIEPALMVAEVVCHKCKGRGNFLSYSGRVVGKCFTCNGTGLSRSATVELKDGDCAKCAGTGEYSPGRRCFTCNGTGKDKAAAAANISVNAIAKAFAAAFASGIKRPKLRLDRFTFSRAPDHGSNAGSIYVKEDDKYLGKVTDGQFRPTFECDDATKARVVEVAAKPHEAAKAYGMRTGSCSCCGRELTNGESIDLGIGPICRGKFGWG